MLRLAIRLEALGRWVRSNRLEDSLVCDNCFMPVPKEVINASFNRLYPYFTIQMISLGLSLDDAALISKFEVNSGQW